MDMAIFEGSDIFLDMEEYSYNKKRSWGEALVTGLDNDADEDSFSFLVVLQQFWEAKFVEDDDADPIYMEFLGKLKEYKNAYMCDVSIDNGVLFPIYYEAEIESPNLESTPTDGHNTLSSSNETCEIGKNNRVSSSSYWKKELHDYLRKPYQRKEYDELWAELDIETPVLMHRESRSGGSYRPGHMGKSLLGKHPDLQREIEKVQSNRPKVLNLLRMLKFYVQKSPAVPGGVCVPWKDDLTKNILPRSS